MSHQYTNTTKLCATCVYWTGQRDLYDNAGNMVTVENQAAKGRCKCRNSGALNLERQANSPSCRYFEKWPLLK